MRYGFTVLAQLPDETPVNSTNAFYIELGYLVNARIIPLSTRAAYTNNYLEFNFELITHVPHNGGLIIQGNENTRGFVFPVDCMEALRVVGDGVKFAVGTTCTYADEMGVPKIQFVAGILGMDAGLYRFEWRVAN